MLESSDIENLHSLVVYKDSRIYRRSEAVLMAMASMGGIWGLGRFLFLFPFRNRVYDFIALHRYRIFGRAEVCRVPSPKERDQFL